MGTTMETSTTDLLGKEMDKDEKQILALYRKLRVLCDRDDYAWARELVLQRELASRFPVHFSPVHGELDPVELAKWIVDDVLDVRLNLQLHKYIWGAEASGV